MMLSEDVKNSVITLKSQIEYEKKLLKSKEHEFLMICEHYGHDWSKYEYTQVVLDLSNNPDISKEISVFFGYQSACYTLHQWTRKCKTCGMVDKTHIIPQELQRRDNLRDRLSKIQNQKSKISQAEFIYMNSIKNQNCTKRINHLNNKIMKMSKQYNDLLDKENEILNELKFLEDF